MHAPLLPAGKRAIASAEQSIKTCQGDTIGDGPRFGIVAPGHLEQFLNLAIFRYPGLLQHDANLASCGKFVRRLPEQAHLAFVNRDQAEQQADGGALAGTIRAQHRKHFASTQLKVDAIKRLMFAIAFTCTAQPGKHKGGLVSHWGHSWWTLTACLDQAVLLSPNGQSTSVTGVMWQQVGGFGGRLASNRSDRRGVPPSTRLW